ATLDCAACGSVQDGVHGVVEDVEKDLLQLVEVGVNLGQVGIEVAVNGDVIQLQIVFAKRQRLFEHPVDLHGASLRLVLARKTQQVLNDAVISLSLLIP